MSTGKLGEPTLEFYVLLPCDVREALCLLPKVGRLWRDSAGLEMAPGVKRKAEKLDGNPA